MFYTCVRDISINNVALYPELGAILFISDFLPTIGMQNIDFNYKER